MVLFGVAAALTMIPSSPFRPSSMAEPAPQDAGPDAGTRSVGVNSPSEATATVSPVTAAAAVESDDPDRSIELSLGTSVATGDFGTSSTTSLWSTALGARVALDRVRFSASIPYMRVRSNASIFTGIDSTPVLIAGGTGPKRTNRGFGDITLGASYTLPNDPGDLEIEVAGRVKLPTASRESRLSSGKFDYSLGVQATKVVGRVAPFVTATYRSLGDPDGFDLRDGVAASAGASLVLDRRTVMIGSYHYAQAASRLVRDAHELFLGGSREFGGTRLRLTAFGTVGMSSGAAAASGGLAISLAL